MLIVVLCFHCFDGFTLNWEFLQGQALAKINIGNVLDSDGDWQGALDAFEESYRYVLLENLHCLKLEGERTCEKRNGFSIHVII